jgi:exopolysaccharide production protein ExoQ
MALERPLLGYGYGAFWLGERGPSARVWAVTWDAVHAHNGYLDLWLQIGVIGALLGISLVLVILIRTARQMRGPATNKVVYELGFLFAVYILVGDITRTTLLDASLGRALYWIVLVYIYFFSGTLCSTRQHLIGTAHND